VDDASLTSSLSAAALGLLPVNNQVWPALPASTSPMFSRSAGARFGLAGLRRSLGRREGTQHGGPPRGRLQEAHQGRDGPTRGRGAARERAGGTVRDMTAGDEERRSSSALRMSTRHAAAPDDDTRSPETHNVVSSRVAC